MSEVSEATMEQRGTMVDAAARYDALRESGDGVYYDEEVRAWTVTRYGDVSSAFRDHKRFSSVDPMPKPEGRVAEMMAQRPHQRGVLLDDPPVHTQMRALFNRAFTPRAVQRMRDTIVELTEGCLDKMAAAFAAGEEVDIVDTLASPLPLSVIAEMLGVPYTDLPRLARWSDAATAFFTPIVSQEVREQLIPEIMAFNGYMTEVVADHKRSPKEDIVSDLLAAEVDGDRLTDGEVVSLSYLMLAAGNETTRTLITNAVETLLTHPDQVALLKERPDLTPSMVEEVLRIAPPPHAIFRRSTEDIAYEQSTIPGGSSVMLNIASANRDPRTFSDPERFDITRESNRHLTFGFGIHFCIGAPLARLEAQEALGRLFRRFPGIGIGETAPERLIESQIPGYRHFYVKAGAAS